MLECKKWLKPKKRDDRACTYFAPIQKLVTLILQIVATTRGFQPSTLDKFHRELKSLAEKSGYRIRTKVSKSFRSVDIFNPDQIFSKKLNTLLKKWEKRIQIEVKYKTEKRLLHAHYKFKNLQMEIGVRMGLNPDIQTDIFL